MADTTAPAGAPSLRILVISNCPLDPLQGSGYVITGYAQRMRERGHHVTAFGIEHFTPFQGMRRLTRIRRLLGYATTALRHARRSYYDVVELWGAEGWLALVLLRLLRRRAPIAVSRSNGLETHWHLAQRREPPSLADRLRRPIQALPQIAFRHSAALTVVSGFDAAFARLHAYQPAERLLVLENPLEPRWLGQAPAFERESLIGFVGAWLPNKGSDVLPEAIRQVLREVPHARVVFIGVEQEGAARIGAAFDGDERVQAIPFCPRPQLVEHYHRMAMLVMASRYESFGLVAAEAMSCGAALVSTRTGFAAGLAEHEYASIAGRTSADIAQALTALLRDEPRRLAIARAGHARVQGLDWGQATDRLEALYQKLVVFSPAHRSTGRAPAGTAVRQGDASGSTAPR